MIEATREKTHKKIYKVKRKRKQKKMPLWKKMIVVLISIIYLGITTALLALYGPFENIRRTIIGMVLTSRHAWYIEPFYSKETLDKYRPSLDNTTKGSMNVGKGYADVNDTGIEVVPIKTMKYSGSLLIINDPKRVHVAATKYLNDVGETVTDMIKRENAIGGINAGGFSDIGGKGTGGVPMGITFSRGQYISGDKNSNETIIGITNEGVLVVGKYTYNELMQLGINDAVSFYPQLVKDGKPYLKAKDDTWGVGPRTAIGQRSDGAILLMVLSGRGNGGIGASLMDVEKEMLNHGAYIAANLDGGYSSEMVYNNQFLVTPSNPLGERYVATSFVIDGVK
jgi:exopolysaccharide biosynthesis protein